MKTLQKSLEIFNLQNFAPVFVLSSLLVFANQASFQSSKTKTASFDSTKNSRIFVSTTSSAVESQQQESGSGDSSIFSKIFGGIGAFFVLVGSGIFSGISATAKFLGQVIAFPVTATIRLFSRKGAAGSTDSSEVSSSSNVR